MVGEQAVTNIPDTHNTAHVESLTRELDAATDPRARRIFTGLCGHASRGRGLCDWCLDRALMSLGVDVALNDPARYIRRGRELFRRVWP
jgi:hypothetical protein